MIGTITLGERVFTLRRFTLRENARAYPLARQLVVDGVIDRWVEALQTVIDALAKEAAGERAGGAPGQWEVSEDEMGRMADFVFMACQASEPDLTREAFDALPVSPRDLFNAFFEARYCTGAWVRPDPAETAPTDDAGEKPEGEADGAPAPLQPTSTSDELSPG
jgi:hypothetical protein